ncbi:tyrosine-type recombinase/integrase [Dysosmobacter sp. Phy]
MAKRRANGEGNIRKRKDGRWEGRYTAGYDQNGKRIIRNVLGRTQAEVKSKLSVAIAESQQLDVSRSGEYTVAEWLRIWFELYAKPNIRPSTAGYYKRGIEQYTVPRIGTIKLNKLSSREIQKLYKDLLESGRTRKQQKKKKPGLSGSTVRGVHIMLHSALDRAVKERLLIRNPADSCVVPKAQHQEDLKAYLDAAERRGSLAMFYLELVSGIRKGELVALQWADLDVEQRTISVSKQATKDEENHLIVARPKTENSVRLISIPQEAVELLMREHAKHPDNPWLFPSSRTGAMYHPDSVATLHQRILKDAGLEHLRFHDLRHTFATLALQNGVDIKTVSAMLGHYDAGFTLRTYTHTTRQKQDEAAQTMGNLMAQVR